MISLSGTKGKTSFGTTGFMLGIRSRRRGCFVTLQLALWKMENLVFSLLCRFAKSKFISVFKRNTRFMDAREVLVALLIVSFIYYSCLDTPDRSDQMTHNMLFL